MRLFLTSNDLRSRFLFAEIAKLVEVAGVENFDDIDPVTKFAAAALSLRYPRAAWWRIYQMHPLVQRRRRQVLQANWARSDGAADALLMWGSWFQPAVGVPFFLYFDESLAPGAAWDLTKRAAFHAQAKTYAAAAGFFCMSEWARRQVISWHPAAAAKTHVVGWGPCGVDLSNEDIAEAERRPMVLHVSNDPLRKGVDYLIETAQLVHYHLPDAEFRVIGDMKGFDVSKADGHVKFIGPIANQELLASWYRRASVLFQPHRYDRSPHVLVEGASAGLPIIATGQGGVIELVEGHDTGFLIGQGDIGGYATAIEALLGNPELRATMGANARALMRHEYTWRRVAEKIAERTVEG